MTRQRASLAIGRRRILVVAVAGFGAVHGEPCLAENDRTGAIARRPSWWTPAAEVAELYSWEGLNDACETSGGSTSLLLDLTDNSADQASAAVARATSATAAAASAELTAANVGGDPTFNRRRWLEVLRLSLSFTVVLKTMCIGSNILFQVSPLPLAQGFHSDGSTGDADSAPFVSVAYGCCQFSFYGLFAYRATQKSGFLILVYSNMLGIVLGVYYVYSFLRNCKNPAMLRITFGYFKAIAAVLVLQLFCMHELPVTRALLIVGLVSSGCSLLSASSLLTTVPEVMRTRCCKSLPTTLLACSAFSSVLWLTCGATLHDGYIVIPNAVSLSMNCFALSLALYFPRECPEILAGKNNRRVYGTLSNARGGLSPAEHFALRCSTGETA